MTDPVHFFLDDKDVMAQPGETIWEVAKRTGTLIPHLCHRDAPGYRPDGNCRVCMVEIKGERVLAPSCLRTSLPGMQVWTGSERARKARRVVLTRARTCRRARTRQFSSSNPPSARQRPFLCRQIRVPLIRLAL